MPLGLSGPISAYKTDGIAREKRLLPRTMRIYPDSSSAPIFLSGLSFVTRWFLSPFWDRCMLGGKIFVQDGSLFATVRENRRNSAPRRQGGDPHQKVVYATLPTHGLSGLLSTFGLPVIH